MKILFLFLFPFVIFSCKMENPGVNPEPVHIQGALKNIMKKGDLSSHADLTELRDSSHVYALGPMENLKGEIIILDDQPFISTVQNDSIYIDQSFNYHAAMLVSASVKKWKQIPVPPNVLAYKELEKYIEQTVIDEGFNANQPFPFLLHGQVKSLDWHVIDWPEGDNEHSHEKHKSSGLNGTLQYADVEVLGFFSKKHQSIITHHTTYMHLHFVTADHHLSGHVDDIKLSPGIVLSLPVN